MLYSDSDITDTESSSYEICKKCLARARQARGHLAQDI